MILDLEGNEAFITKPSEPMVKWWQFWRWHRMPKIRAEWDIYYWKCRTYTEYQLRVAGCLRTVRGE